MLYKGKSHSFLASLKMGEPGTGNWRKARMRPQCSLTSKPDTYVPCYTVYHIQALESSLLDSATGPKIYSKIPEATERNKALPQPLKCRIYLPDHHIPLSKCFMYMVLC